MSLPEPPIDERRYRDILAEAMARIPVHNPEWTNLGDSDPGVTMVQLFAFMVESLSYRANRIPERNRHKFLQLLGVGRRSATSAEGLVAFDNPRGQIEPRLVPAGAELFAGAVPFRTTDEVDVLPIQIETFYKAHPQLDADELDRVDRVYRQLYASYEADGSSLDFYETTLLPRPARAGVAPAIVLEDDTVDGFLWVAILARTAAELPEVRDHLENRWLSIGIVPDLTASRREVPPRGGQSTVEQLPLVFERPAGFSASGPPVARYQALPSRADVDVLQEPGVVRVQLPPKDEIGTWTNLDPLEGGVGGLPPQVDDEELASRIATWIRVRAGTDGSEEASPMGVRITHVSAHATRVVQRAHVQSEPLGRGTGEPDQSFTLINTPVLLGTEVVAVDGEPWQRIDDLLAAAPEIERLPDGGTVPASTSNPTAKVYSLDRASGTVAFGDGHRGARPRRGAVIRATYDYGGGTAGLVGIGAINKGPSLPAGVKVGNPIATWGGAEAESVDEALRTVPARVRHRDRLVTQDDFEALVRDTPGVDLGRVEVLPLVHPQAPEVSAPGVVTIMVIPRLDARHPEAPRPDRLVLDTVCRHLEPRRLLTTELHIIGPRYWGVLVSVGVESVAGQSPSTVNDAVGARVRQFLSPLVGGHSGDGWPLGTAVQRLELVTAVARVPGVAKITALLLSSTDALSVESIPMAPLELPRLAGISVQSGVALPLEALGGTATSDPDGSRPRVPIPIVPPEC